MNIASSLFSVTNLNDIIFCRYRFISLPSLSELVINLNLSPSLGNIIGLFNVAIKLLLDENNNIPNDYKCYVFGGKLYYTAVTYDRKVIQRKLIL